MRFKKSDHEANRQQYLSAVRAILSDKSGQKITGHDIRAMIREVNPQDAFILRDIRLKNGGGSVPPNRYNELWRYGPEVEDSIQEEDAEKILVKIADWLKTII